MGWMSIMDGVTVVGVAGLVFIILGWLVSIRSVPPVRLSGLYALGSFFLIVYSYLIDDPLFLVLNIGAFAVSFAQFYRGLRSGQPG